MGASSGIAKLKYKLGDGEWTSYTFGSTIDLEDGIALQFKKNRGNEGFSSSASKYNKVVVDGSGTVIVSGNIMSLAYESLETLALSSFIFYKLFEDCTKLTSAANLILPATTLASYCYSNMFRGCTSLTTAPKELPATTLQSDCYYGMFQNCTSLTTAPELPARKLVSGCYGNMFYGCSNLNYIKALFTTTSSGVPIYWVYGVSDTGTFVKSKDATWDITGVSGVPSGWTIITE